MDIPGAGIWAAIILLLAIMQLPPLLVLGPIAIWVFSVADPIPATIFLVYALFVSFSDAFLKPLLLGSWRGCSDAGDSAGCDRRYDLVRHYRIILRRGDPCFGATSSFMAWLNPEEGQGGAVEASPEA